MAINVSESPLREAMCVICLEELVPTDGTVSTEVKTTRCFHHFHSMCLDPWLVSHGTCPTCRGGLTQGDISINSQIVTYIRAHPDDSTALDDPILLPSPLPVPRAPPSTPMPRIETGLSWVDVVAIILVIALVIFRVIYLMGLL